MATVPPSTTPEPKTTIKSVDMTEEMSSIAIDVAKKAISSNNVEKDIAQYIKKEFDTKFGSTWHCIVGRNFGSFVTHETKNFIYFYVGHLAVLLFKTA
ncbi:dynein light chain type 1-domain-containing protein [Tuber indicum]|nr:dynein light chain type 1-domain-containing protein [Tuber indicum]